MKFVLSGRIYSDRLRISSETKTRITRFEFFFSQTRGKRRNNNGSRRKDSSTASGGRKTRVRQREIRETDDYYNFRQSSSRFVRDSRKQHNRK